MAPASVQATAVEADMVVEEALAVDARVEALVARWTTKSHLCYS